MKKADASQIDKLYRFTRQHYVEYYDVQTELVDHLAHGIEEQWKEDSEVPFEEALQREFKKFGVYGFSDVVEKRERAMEKKYFKLILKEIFLFLGKPSFVLPIISFFLVCSFLLRLEQGIHYLTYAIICYFLVLVIALSRRSFSWKKKKRTGKRILLLEAVIIRGSSYSLFFYLPLELVYFGFDSGKVENIFVQILLAALFTFLVLASYICFYHLPKKKDDILQKAHPEIKFLQ